MINKQYVCVLTCAGVLTLAMLWEHQPAVVGSIVGTGEKSLNLVAEYKKNILEDISDDGKFILFYQTNIPTRSYSVPLDGSGSKANQSQVYDDVLRVVDRPSGREVGRTRVEFFPLEQQFIPGTQQVFYGEPKPRSNGEWRYKLWEPISGETQLCLDAPEGRFSSVTFLEARTAFGIVSRKNGGDLLLKLNLADCTRTIIGSVDPEYPKGRIWSRLAVSPDGRFLAYTIYAGSEVIIWDIANEQVAKSLNRASLSFGDKLAYTPDGKYLIVAASTNPFGDRNAKNYLLFYGTKTYQQALRLEVPAVSAMAVSPDSQALAIGYTKEEKQAFSTTKQAHVVLYDLATGRELARASHPPVKEERSDAFAARITQLAFTPDGKYLLSSTYDTRVWQIENRSGD